MKLTNLLPTLLASYSAAAPSPNHQTPSTQHQQRIPTSRESAVLARRILSLTPIGTLATTFPASSPENASSASSIPAELSSKPLALMDYIADCTPNSHPGDPTILALNIETHFRNVAAGSNISLALRWHPPHPPSKRIQSSSFPSSFLDQTLSYLGLARQSQQTYDPVPYSAANLPRFNLMGYIEPLPDSDGDKELRNCFTAVHPDAKYWLPGNRIHEAHFVRLVVTHVYWIGGFGDRAYIGWIPVEEWRNVTAEEIEGVRLPGEKEGWEEWRVDEL